MGKTSDLFKKTGDTKGIFHANIRTREDKNGKKLTEAEEIKESWQKYPDYLYRKALNDPDSHNGVVTHLEPDILKCVVKWSLGSLTKNKASGCGVIPAEVFQILKDDAVKVLYSTCQQIWNTQQWPQDRKRSVFILIPKNRDDKECSNYHKIALILHAEQG